MWAHSLQLLKNFLDDLFVVVIIEAMMETHTQTRLGYWVLLLLLLLQSGRRYGLQQHRIGFITQGKGFSEQKQVL